MSAAARTRAVGNTKPLVVLAGWLGCQPRFLRRYVDLYQGLGCDVHTVIAPPVTIMQSTYQPMRTNNDKGWKDVLMPAAETTRDVPTMEGMAENTIQIIAKSDPPAILFHVFSNGGGFMYEHITRQLLLARQQEAVTDKNSLWFHNNSNNDPIQKMSAAIRGTIFDSCPAWFGQESSILDKVLEHCYDDERLLIEQRLGRDIFTNNETPNQRQVRQLRNQQYFDHLQDSPLDVLQLYLYSADDPLSAPDKIREIIKHRSKHFRGPIFSKAWSQSVHCAHLLEHTDEYTTEIESFVTLALQQSRL